MNNTVYYDYSEEFPLDNLAQGYIDFHNDGGNIQNIIHNNGKGKVERNSPYLIFHQAVNRKPISAIRFGKYKLVKDWRYNKLELFNLSEGSSNFSTSFSYLLILSSTTLFVKFVYGMVSLISFKSSINLNNSIINLTLYN